MSRRHCTSGVLALVLTALLLGVASPSPASPCRKNPSHIKCQPSEQTSEVSAPVNTSLPEITGTAQVGQTLTASEGSWLGSPTGYAYQWLRCDSAGANCAQVSGAGGKTLLLASADEGRTLRIVVTAGNSAGSASATSAQTAVVIASSSSSSPSSTSFPASYSNGPLGSRNILPPKASGAFLGIWDTGMQQALDRESYVGRKFDILTATYNAASGKCYNYAPFADGKSQKQVEHGAIPMVSWSPGFTLDQINAGQADHCFRDVAQRAVAFKHLFFLRMYHEHNGTWMIYSGCGQKFIDAWRRTVSIFRAEGATNIAWVWNPSEGFRVCAFESYPGDEWVDWVATGGYNHNKSTAWCGYHAGWCEFWEIYRFDPKVSLHDRFGPRKPVMFTETGTVEDAATPGRKGQWFRLARDKMRSDLVYGKALVYFDILFADGDWRVNTSQSAYEGFRDLARDPHFNTR